jgi:hypothetical protein
MSSVGAKPTDVAAAMDTLIRVNIDMWHAQERIYEMESLERGSKEELRDFLQASTWLNLQRNTAMDAVNRALVAGLPAALVASPPPAPVTGPPRCTVWEPA